MPIETHVIENSQAYGGSALYSEGSNQSAEALLNGVLMSNMMGVLHELGRLATHATEIFDGLFELAKGTNERMSMLTGRAGRLSEAVQRAHRALESSHMIDSAKVDRTEDLSMELFTKRTMPKHMKLLYDGCQVPPALGKVAKFSSDEQSPMTKYSNPNLFIEEWLREESVRQEKAAEDRKARRERRKNRKKKKQAKQPKTVQVKAVKAWKRNAMGAEFANDEPTAGETVTVAAQSVRDGPTTIQATRAAPALPPPKPVEQKRPPPPSSPQQQQPAPAAVGEQEHWSDEEGEGGAGESKRPAPPSGGAAGSPGRAMPPPPRRDSSSQSAERVQQLAAGDKLSLTRDRSLMDSIMAAGDGQAVAAVARKASIIEPARAAPRMPPPTAAQPGAPSSPGGGGASSALPPRPRPAAGPGPGAGGGDAQPGRNDLLAAIRSSNTRKLKKAAPVEKVATPASAHGGLMAAIKAQKGSGLRKVQRPSAAPKPAETGGLFGALTVRLLENRKVLEADSDTEDDSDDSDWD